MQRGGGVQLSTLMMITSMARTYCLSGSMVLPGVELLYISPPLRRGGIRGVRQRLNPCFTMSARSSGRRWRMCVWNVQKQMRSELKFGSATLRQTIPVLHNMYIAHTTFSNKYIIIKSCIIFLCHQCSTMLIQIWQFFVHPTVCFLHAKYQKSVPRLRGTVTSIDSKFH